MPIKSVWLSPECFLRTDQTISSWKKRHTKVYKIMSGEEIWKSSVNLIINELNLLNCILQLEKSC